MGIRNKLVEWVGGKELQEQQTALRQSIDYLVDAWQYQTDPQTVIETLKEYDSAALVDLIHDIEYERIGGVQSALSNDGRRERQVQESCRMWLNSPLANWTVNVWTSSGIGEGVDILLEDDNMQRVWQDCVYRSSVLSSDTIHELSNWVLVYGNDFLVQFISELDGTSTWDLIPAEEIVDMVRDNNTGKVLFYKRQFTDSKGVGQTWYYPNADLFLADNWYEPENILPQGAIRTDVIMEGKTIALMCHIAHNRKEPQSAWGWPILGIAAPYMRAHKEFVENRLTVSRNKATAVREYTTKGGSRAVSALRAKLTSTLSATNVNDTNPPAVAGSDLIHNEAVSMKDLPMNTGASDAKTDNEMFAWLALIGAGLFPTSAGLDTSRWATAVAMDKTQATQWTRYKSFWTNNIRRIVRLTLKAAEKYGNVNPQSYDCTVSIDTLSLVDFPGIVGPIAQMLNSLLPYVENGTMGEMPAKQIVQNVWLIILQALGISDADEIMNDEAMGITPPTQTSELWGELRKINKFIESQK